MPALTRGPSRWALSWWALAFFHLWRSLPPDARSWGLSRLPSNGWCYNGNIAVEFLLVIIVVKDFPWFWWSLWWKVFVMIDFVEDSTAHCCNSYTLCSLLSTVLYILSLFWMIPSILWQFLQINCRDRFTWWSLLWKVIQIIIVFNYSVNFMTVSTYLNCSSSFI